MNFSTVSAILRGEWLLNKEWASSHLPVVAGLMKGEKADFGITQKNDHVTIEKLDVPVFVSVGKTVNVYSVRPYSNINSLEYGSIAVVQLHGPMLKNGDVCSYGMLDQAQLINRLADAKNIGGIIIDLDSPGGQADGTALLAGAIKEATTKKPVISFINDGMAASAGMWIASAASEIYGSQPTDEFGSIGVYTTIADWAGYYESQGLKTVDIYAPQSTDKNKGYYDALNGDTTLITEGLSVLANQFINTISTNRAGKIKGDAWKTGKMFFAADAKKIGLIDGIKTFSQVVDRINTLISNKQQSTKNTMAFEKTLVAAGAESFEVTDQGFVLSEENLNGIEGALATVEAAATVAAELATANATIGTLNTNVEGLNLAATAAQATISTQAARIVELEAENASLGKQPSGKGTKLKVTEDENGDAADANGKLPRFDDPEHPGNKAASRYTRTKK